MLPGFRPRLTFANVTSVVALVLALGGAAYAASATIPDSNGVFHGCVSKKTGTLRVVGSANRCRGPRGRGKHRNPGEFAIAWNQTGPQGVRGLQGASGQSIQGPPGTARAYAVVQPSLCTGGPPAVCTLSKSKGVSSVTRVATGFYCVTAPGISSVDEPLIVSVEFESTSSPESLAAAMYDDTACGPGDTGFGVETKRPSTFSADAPANDIGFVVAIP